MVNKKRLRCHGLPERLVAFRRTHRIPASRLARIAGMSPQAVSQIELGKVTPGIDTVERIANAAGMDAAFLAYGAPSHTAAATVLIPPGFNPLALVADLNALLSGSTGVVDDVYKYLDPAGAFEWAAMLKQSEFSALVASVPLADLVQTLAADMKGHPSDIIALGCGTGDTEVRLVSRLLGKRVSDFRLVLLDISNVLLVIAVQHATECLKRSHSVPCVAVLGDFRRLTDYNHLFAPDSPRRRVFTMFGYTFANLDNEVQFLRRSLSWASEGDLLLLDLPEVATTNLEPTEIRRKDPGFAQRRGEDWVSGIYSFLTVPIRRNLLGIETCKVYTELDLTSCVVPGSYAVVNRVTIRLKGGEEKRFSVGYSKRYDREKLAATMSDEGWVLRETFSYGTSFFLALFERKRVR